MKTRHTLPPLLGTLLLGVGAVTSSLAGDFLRYTSPAISKPRMNLLAEINDKGVTFPFCYVGEVLGNPSGGYRQGAIYEGVLKAGVQLDFEKLLGWKGATLLVNGLYPQGASLTDKYVHDFNTLSNIDAYDSVRLYEAWFQQDFDSGKFSIRIGLMLADYEFFISDSSALFLNSAFGALPILSKNLDSPVYPLAAPGVRVRFTPNDHFSAQFAAFTGDPGDAATTNRHGLYDFEENGSALLLGEIAYTLNPPPEVVDDPDGKAKAGGNRPLSGTYKLGAYYYSADLGPLDGARQSVANYALYGIADQEVWHEPGDPDQGLNLFGRIGGSPDDRSTVPFYFDTGFNYKGPLPSRDKDIFGIGVSYTKINDSLRDESGLPVASHHETIIEVTYLVSITDWLYVQPDFQYIFNPGATEDLPDAVVVGMRFGINF